ncbi:MAG: hypothetical protein GX886_10950 [Comamonadaceae bacterium]|nr:hypothetical protein [Comamonadaceae bacterium]
MAVDPETGEILETAPGGVEQAQSDQKPTGGIADQLETIVRSGATGDALQAQVRGIMRDAEADDVLAALKDRPDLDPIAQMGLSDAAWSMLRNDLLDARGVAPEDRSIYDLAEEDAPASAVEWRFADMVDALFNDDSEGWLEGADAERALGFTEEDESDAIENAAGTAGSTQADVAGAAQTGTSAIPPSTPAQAAGKGQQALGQLDVSGRTPEQLNYLATNGQPGWKEAAQAEIQRRAEPPTEAQPTQTPTAPEQSRPAPSQRSESAQPSEAIPPATSEGWDGMTAEQRAAVLTKPGGWSTAKGKLNVIGKQIAGRNWSAINPTTRATIERLMQGEQTANVPKAQQVAPQAQEARGQEGAASGQSGLTDAQRTSINETAGSFAVGDSIETDDGSVVIKKVFRDRDGKVSRYEVEWDGDKYDALPNKDAQGFLNLSSMLAPQPYVDANTGERKVGSAGRVVRAAQPAKAPSAPAPQAQEASGQEGEGARTQSQAAVTPAAERFDSQSGTTRTQAERDLWEKGAESERASSSAGRSVHCGNARRTGSL